MADERILITGATGNVGGETLLALKKDTTGSSVELIAAVRDPANAKAVMQILPDRFVKLDFTNSNTFASALTGITRVLLIRPAELSDVDAYFKPFIAAMKQAAVRHVTFLSLQGVEHNPIVPHHAIEKLIVEAGLSFTFLRPSFFMQNLCHTHRDEIRLRNEIFVPAGNGRTSLIDVRDVAAVAARTLTSQSNEYRNRGYELTGSDALTYYEIAQLLSRLLDRQIIYKNPSMLEFIWQKWHRENRSLAHTLVKTALYTVARLGKAADLTNETEQLLGRPPITFEQFAIDHRAAWLP
ncbi:SDR family oxidoreductase [Spirosoma oryzicola]|uniref:SDR family oxidoreductase n=1 Tax=Spirosoma oryzicola TaxID=2898794 RepID=UPI001E44219C|nr:SDR family oxidoreductase [Spirosoma oryzicola]UHG89955.1 SDR family oxidoreductase [Spirosoma oryzicola]